MAAKHDYNRRMMNGDEIFRSGGRGVSQARELRLTSGFVATAEGSVLIEVGHTRVLCNATVQEGVPAWMRNSGRGWVTAEYAMLPRATLTRTPRESERGKIGGRTHEIQRLIGRSLRAVVDRAAMGEMTVTLDCDVLNADGGTRCAAITGAWVALALAFRHLRRMNVLARSPLTGAVAAVSCGVADGVPVLDLDYEEDSAAEADANFVLTEAGGLVEVQATAERAVFSEARLVELLALARQGTAALSAAQRDALGPD